MKKVLCLMITVALLFTSSASAFAKNNKQDKKNDHEVTKYDHNKRIGSKKYEFRFDKSKQIKYGRYKLPTSPITNGMGANLKYDKQKSVITIEKGSIKIVIDFKKETVTVNGVIDTNCGIFTAKNSNKMTVFIRYIADLLGMRTDFDKDKVIVEVPGLDYPTSVTVTPKGNLVIANTLNSTNLSMNAQAKIKAGQATGGKAELYVGSKLVATDNHIAATDTSVTFTTSDNSPTNSELQAAVPKGGVVTVKLYNAQNKSIISKTNNPTLKVDYVIPKINDITSATYDMNGGKIYLTVNGAGAVGDKVNLTKLTLYDTLLGRAYQLTEASGTGSTGIVKSENFIELTLGSVDKANLAGFGGSTLLLNIEAGAFLKDDAGNTSTGLSQPKTISVTVSNLVTAINAPSHVTVTPVGGTVKANTLNTTNLYMTASAKITPGQATGGRAELYVDSKLISIDANITATDTSVTFTTADDSPTNAELQAIVPKGGEVVVKLYSSYGISVSSSLRNPTLIVDYVIPTISGIATAIYHQPSRQIFLTVNGADAIGDKLDVTKLTIYDASTGKNYRLTNASDSGSSGSVSSTTTLTINLGATDWLATKDFGKTTVSINIAEGALLRDDAGNSSIIIPSLTNIPVTVIK